MMVNWELDFVRVEFDAIARIRVDESKQALAVGESECLDCPQLPVNINKPV